MKPPTKNQADLMRQILRGEEEYGLGNYGVFASGGVIPGLLKRGFVEYLDTLDDGDGGKAHAVYTLTPDGRSWLASLQPSDGQEKKR